MNEDGKPEVDEQHESMTPEKCPRYMTCNAAICPLEADWRKRVHASSDSTCLFLCESRKPTRDQVFIGEQGQALTAACDTLFAELERIERASPMGMPGGLNIVLATARGAASSGSRILNARERGIAMHRTRNPETEASDATVEP